MVVQGNYGEMPECSSGGDGERVVISGMSGLYPQSNNIKELCDVLYNKVNPISTPRYQFKHPEVPQSVGSVTQLDRFDAQFFGVHYRLSENMDIMSRKMLEHTFQAIYDAGLSPEHLSGKKVGVYIGICVSETEKAAFYLASTRDGFGIIGCSKAMFANRISYWLNSKGPSVAIDESCCSSSAALEQAYQAIVRGDCDSAIVGGANVAMHPQTLVHSARAMKLCMDGKTKCFDENADGCAKSEAINILFLQKAKSAMRIYADLVYVKSSFLSKQEDSGSRFGFHRDPLMVERFLKSFYDEAGISPKAVEYVEAFGSATPENDKTELEVISEVFCKDREDTLLVGSVMSNIGYTEAATGITAITKVLLGYHRGELAANLHCTNPRKDVPALLDGRIRIVTEHQPFRRSFAAINNLAITGCNVHVLLRGHYKPKDPSRYKTSVPHLVMISGRQETAVKYILDNLKSHPIDPEELALLHNIHKMKINGHLGRGYTILDTNSEQQTVSLASACEYFDEARRPLWFLYSGMGSQWAGMGTQLMRIPVFALAIQRCQKVLESKGLDIIHIITSPDKTIFDNIMNSFVGIAAVQIGLTDVMRELGLVPDKIIGHSVGELGCAYADGCITAEEMILSAYSRGLVSLQTPLIHGSMAAVGIGYQQIVTMIPPEIEVACHNSPDSSTISGPSEIIKEFVASLAAKGIFAKEVPCSNIAYHSRYIADAGPGLLHYLSEVIKEPKPRSERWLSTSVPQERWDEPDAKYSSAKYHTNNLLNPVLFEETSQLIPPNAVIVEIAPHGLLQAILKRSLPKSCKYLPLTRRGHPDNAFIVLEAIGKLFMEGYNPKVEVLYPKVEFPVSTSTPFLSHLVQWAHNEKWSVPLYLSTYRIKGAAACTFIITTQDDENKYMLGNTVRGKNVYPFAASLVAVWDTFAMSNGLAKKGLSVEFHDVNLYVQPILNQQVPLKLSVSLHKGSGWFEIMDGISTVATGYIVNSSTSTSTCTWREDNGSDVEMIFNSEDIYQMLCEKECLYKGNFQSIQAANQSFTEAYLSWDNNWVTLMDGMLQLNMLRQEHEAVSQVTYIKRLYIDINKHSSAVKIDDNGKAVIKATISDLYDYMRCGGILMKNVKLHNLLPMDSNKLTLKALKFVPRFQSEIMDIKTAIQIYIQIVAENVNKNKLNVVEVHNSQDFKVIDFDLDDIPELKISYILLSNREFLLKQHDRLQNTDIPVIINGPANEKFLDSILSADSFFITCEKTNDNPSNMCHIVSSYNISDNLRLSLARWKPVPIPMTIKTVTVLTASDLPLLLSKRESQALDQKLLIITNYPPIDGMKDLIVQWRASPKNQVSLVMVNHKIAKDQNADQLPDLELAFNVLQYGVWGGVYYVPVTETPNDVSRNISLGIGRIGDLASLRWVETSESQTHQLRVKVNYAGLNIVDARRATGVSPARTNLGSISFGMDYSGITESGQKVMGIVANGACSKWVRAIPELTWPVPDHWTMEEAATVPLPYAHALYCLGIKIKMRQKGSILIHGGAGGLGQAVISISLAFGYQVFVTVSDRQKKLFLKRMFPELKEDHIGYSRDDSFEAMVKTHTNGNGVWFVFNCLPGELKNTSMKCASNFGIIFDTVQISNNEDYNFGMQHLQIDKNFIPVDFSSMFTENNHYEMRKLQLLMSEGIARGYVRPLSHVTYQPHEGVRALRLLEASRHRGRVLLRLADIHPPAIPRIISSPEKTHLLLCDEEYSGLQLAGQLVAHGVRKLVINLPKIPASAIKRKISWEKRGVDVKVTATKLSESKDFCSLVKESNMYMGPIEGIYFVSTVNNKTSREILSEVDVVSRKLCPSLRYFAVISADDNFGNRICISRVQDKFPATKLTMPSLKKAENAGRDASSWRGLLDVVEKAMRSSDPVINAQPGNKAKFSLLEKIAAVSDLKIPKDLSCNTVLKDIGISNVNAPAIAVLLRNEYNIWLTEKDILWLSVQRIRDIEQYLEGVEVKEIKGLEIFFSHVETDELMAIDIVYMSTLTSTVSMTDYEVDTSQATLCIVSGIEGNYQRFTELCERIKIAALVLQPGLDFPNESIRELAKRYTKMLLKRIRSDKEFYLLGYESGVMVALEIASILEDHGMQGTVYCIGAAPEEFQRLLEEELDVFSSEEALQNAIIRHMYKLIMGSPCTVDFADLTWREKVERSVRALLGHAPLSSQYTRALFEAAYGRIAQARGHVPVPRGLRSRVVFLHAGRTGTGQTDAESLLHQATNELQQYSQQPVVVHQLSAPLAHALSDLNCAAVVNRHLSEALLSAADATNRCDTYVINASRFLTTKMLTDDTT